MISFATIKDKIKSSTAQDTLRLSRHMPPITVMPLPKVLPKKAYIHAETPIQDNRSSNLALKRYDQQTQDEKISFKSLSRQPRAKIFKHQKPSGLQKEIKQLIYKPARSITFTTVTAPSQFEFVRKGKKFVMPRQNNHILTIFAVPTIIPFDI